MRAYRRGVMDWHVLHLKPRCEKKMAGYCVKLELAYYLPLRRETKVYQRRKVTVEKPVFPGYFFAAFDRAGRLSLLRSNYIVRLMEVPDRRAFLRAGRRLASIKSCRGACCGSERVHMMV